MPVFAEKTIFVTWVAKSSKSLQRGAHSHELSLSTYCFCALDTIDRFLEMEKNSGLQMPSLAFFTLLPACLAGVFYAMQWTLSAQHVLPRYLPQDVSAMAFRCVALSTLPMTALALVVVCFRVLTRAGDTLARAESPLMQVHVNALTNTAEQTLLFVLNLLAFSTQEKASAERLLLFTLFFCGGRVLFWLGYLAFYLTHTVWLRGPGMAVALGVNVFLLSYNLSHLLSS